MLEGHWPPGRTRRGLKSTELHSRTRSAAAPQPIRGPKRMVGKIAGGLLPTRSYAEGYATHRFALRDKISSGPAAHSGANCGGVKLLQDHWNPGRTRKGLKSTDLDSWTRSVAAWRTIRAPTSGVGKITGGPLAPRAYAEGSEIHRLALLDKISSGPAAHQGANKWGGENCWRATGPQGVREGV